MEMRAIAKDRIVQSCSVLRFQVGTPAGVLNAGPAVAKPAAKGMSSAPLVILPPADASGNENKIGCLWRSFGCDSQLGGMFRRTAGLRKRRLSLVLRVWRDGRPTVPPLRR